MERYRLLAFSFLFLLISCFISCTGNEKPLPDRESSIDYKALHFLKVSTDSVSAPQIRAFDERKVRTVSSGAFSTNTLETLYKPAGEPLEIELKMVAFKESSSPAPVRPKVIPARGTVYHGFFPEIVTAKDMAQENKNMLGIGHFGKLQGLKNDYVCKIIQDRRGNLWIATRGGGVCRYDGKTFAHFTEKEGLFSNNIWDIMEDHHGNIWMAGIGGGISRYEGNRGNESCAKNTCGHHIDNKSERLAHRRKLRGTFTNFQINFGFPNQISKGLFEDRRGRVWFGVSGGLCVYDGKNFAFFGEDQGFPIMDVQSVSEDREGNIWMATLSGGLLKVNIDRLGHPCWLRSCGHRRDRVSDKIQHEKELYNTLVAFEPANQPAMKNMYKIRFDSKEQVWIGTENGVMKVQSGLLQTDCLKGKCRHEISTTGIKEHIDAVLSGKVIGYNHTNGILGSAALSLEEDHRHHIWISTFDGGVSRFDGKNFFYVSEQNGLPGNETFCTFEDRHRNIWIGGRGLGISKYSGEAFTHISEKEGLPHKRVNGITGDGNGVIWIASQDGGITSLKGGKIMTGNWQKNDEKYPSSCLSADSKSRIWQGHWGAGVVCLENNKFKIFRDFNQTSGLLINFIVPDQNDNIWIGSWENGLLRYDGKTIIRYTVEQGLSQNQLSTACVDHKGNLWVGMFDGSITVLKPSRPDSPCQKQTCSHHPENPKELAEHQKELYYEISVIKQKEEKAHPVSSIICDKFGRIWIAELGNGIRCIDGNKGLSFTTAEGLVNDFTKALAEDSAGNIWVGSSGGISRLNRKKFREIESDLKSGKAIDTENLFTNFTYADGFLGVGSAKNAIWIGKDQQVWIGTDDRLTVMKQHQIKRDTISPQIQITSIDLFNEKIDWTTAAMFPDTTLSLKNGMSITDFRFDSLMRWYEVPANLSLAHHNNFLTFKFIAPGTFQSHKIRYRYMLEGLENNWNSITEKTEANYGNLSPGSYIFKVYAINSDGLKGEEFHYSFTIRPPWWKTWWAYVSYVILSLLSLVLFIRRRERNLKQRQRELEVKVDEATSEIRHQKEEIEKEKNRSDELLLNILPEEVAEELKNKGEAEAKQIDEVTVLFTDFKGFTSLSEKLSPKELVNEIHACFSAFDKIMLRHGVEKIKTIGDAYMAAGGLPVPNKTHAQDVVNAALDIQAFMEMHKKERQARGALFFEIRIGVHTGPVVAGIVGVKKFAYDIWGDTVNTASRMESSGEVGKVNISDSTYARVKDDFSCTFRGRIQAKGKGEINMYFVEGRNK